MDQQTPLGFTPSLADRQLTGK